MLHVSTDTFTPARMRRPPPSRGQAGGGGAAIDLVIGILPDGRVLVVAWPRAKLGTMRDVLTDWDGDGQHLSGVLCPACARRHLTQIKRPFGWHARADDDHMVVLATAAMRREVLERLVAHVH
jgi:hypothetical protein